jgi:Fic family protein
MVRRKKVNRIVNEDILRAILIKKQILEKNSNYHLLGSNGKKKDLRLGAIRHSVGLELEGYDTHTAKGRKLKARDSNRCKKNLSKAMAWGLKNYEGKLLDSHIQEIASLIEPAINKGGYRQERVRISGSSWIPPAPEKLHREMNRFLSENRTLDNVVEKAVHAHFHIARIHPFDDGNGRTARAVQNIVLENSNFYPAIIMPAERVEYLHLIDNAIISYKRAEGDLSSNLEEKRERLDEALKADFSRALGKSYSKVVISEISGALDTSEQKDFYNFLALKIRDTLRAVENDLYKASQKQRQSKRVN